MNPPASANIWALRDWLRNRYSAFADQLSAKAYSTPAPSAYFVCADWEFVALKGLAGPAPFSVNVEAPRQPPLAMPPVA